MSDDLAEIEAWASIANGVLGRSELADELAAAAAGHAHDQGHPATLTVVALAAARAERRRGRDVAAEARLREAVRLAPVGALSIAARTALGWQLHLTGHRDDADRELDLAVGEADEGGHSFLLARARHQRGVAMFHRGRVDEASVEFSAAIEIDRLAGRSTASTFSGLADVLAEQGNLVAARRWYEQARALATEEGETGFVRTIDVRLAGILALDDLDVAWAMAHAALGDLPPDSYWSGLIPAIAGVIAIARGDQSSAASLAARAIDATRVAVPELVVAESLLLRALAMPSDARDHVSGRTGAEALAAWRGVGNPVWLARAEAALATRDHGPRGRAALERARRKLRRLGVSRLGVGPGGGPLVALEPDVEALEIRCLGGFAVLRDGRVVPTAEWQSRKARDLLKLLVASRGRPVPREVLMEALWPDEELDRQANRLSVALATARSVLDPGRDHPGTWYVTSDGDRYGLDLGHLPIDVERFLVQAGLALDDPDLAAEAARDLLETAETTYTGDAFEDDPYADWAAPLREEGRARYAAVARRLAELATLRGDTDAAVRYRLRLLQRDPFDEHAHLELVRLLAAARRHGDARRAYQSYVARMEEMEVAATAFPGPP